LDVDAIDWIEAADNYVQLHAGGTSHLVHGTLAKLEARLAAAQFLRVHLRPSSMSRACRRWSR
jgi:two-component system LytT family response regulator